MKKLITINCKKCSKPFKTHECFLKYGKKYCSHKCSASSTKNRKGTKTTELARKNLSAANKKRFTDRTRHPRWKGKNSKIDDSIRIMDEYKKWRSSVFERDSWTCKTCGKNGCYVVAHHMKHFNTILFENNIKNTADARGCDELWDVSNGVTLCEPCHKLVHSSKLKNV